MPQAHSKRTLHFPKNIGGHPFGLSKKEKNQGLKSSCITLQESHFRFASDYTLYRGNNSFVLEMVKWGFFIFSLFYYHDFHFNYGTKFFTYIAPDYQYQKNPFKKFAQFLYSIYCRVFGKFDLFVLKLLGKKISFTFQGDDIRQGDYCRKNYAFHFANEVPADYYTAYTDDRKRKLIELYDRYADHLYALNPDLMNVLPQRTRFVPYQHIFKKEESLLRSNNVQFTIIHAPTDRLVKGTNHILKALEQLQNEGMQLNIKLIENLTYEEALKNYQDADLAIDQIWAGWYGAFAVDVMQFGIPVMAYLRPSDLIHLPKEFLADLPILNIDPEKLKQSIKIHIESVQAGRIDRQKIKDFVDHWHIRPFNRV